MLAVARGDPGPEPPGARGSVRLVPGVRRPTVAVLAVLATLGAACNRDEPVTPILPSSAFPSVTGTSGDPTGPAVSGPDASGPSGITGSSGDLTEGTLDLRIAGDVELETSLPRLISGVAAAAPGGFAVVWSGAGMDATTVGIGGGSFRGTQATAPTLVLTITAQTAEGLSTWVSSAGECEVTLEDAGPDRFAGSFACGSLASSMGEVVEVSGSFEATR